MEGGRLKHENTICSALWCLHTLRIVCVTETKKPGGLYPASKPFHRCRGVFNKLSFPDKVCHEHGSDDSKPPIPRSNHEQNRS
jgi:hypothetical protein